MKVISAKDPSAVTEAVEVIRTGGLIAFPTDTVYGLGADAADADAVRRVYEVKGRKRTKPLAFLVADRREILRYVDVVPQAGRVLMERFWPGPLTIILEGSGGPAVAFRMPDCRFALDMIREAGVPFVTTSANLSEGSSPVDADMVRASLGRELDLLVDGGRTTYGEGSSIVRLSGGEVRMVRQGPIPREEIEKAIA
jgi:L-threonylcarbamoyladenylate synthase